MSLGRSTNYHFVTSSTKYDLGFFSLHTYYNIHRMKKNKKIKIMCPSQMKKRGKAAPAQQDTPVVNEVLLRLHLVLDTKSESRDGRDYEDEGGVFGGWG